MKINLSNEELVLVTEALLQLNKTQAYDIVSSINQQINETINGGHNSILNENIQLGDKVYYDKIKAYVIGEFDNKLIIQSQGSTFYVNINELKPFNAKDEISLKPPMKFDKKTQALLSEQLIRCGIYQGSIPIKINDCYVKYNSWNKAKDNQNIKVIVEGSPTYISKTQIRILENINDIASEENYIPGVIIDEETEDVIENILVNAIDYTNAIGDADSIRIIKSIDGDQEIQTLPKSVIRTLSV